MKITDEEEQVLLIGSKQRERGEESHSVPSSSTGAMIYRVIISVAIVLLMICGYLSHPAQRIKILRFINFQDSNVPDTISSVTEGICSLQPSLVLPSPNCEGTYVNFKTTATPEGLWPKGLSWYLVENVFDLKGVFGRMAYENGPSDDTIAGMGCTSFSKILCLHGNYIFHTSDVNIGNIEVPGSVYVDICGPEKRVMPGSTVNFEASSLNCVEPDFSKIIPTTGNGVKQPTPQMDEKAIEQEKIQTASSFLAEASKLLDQGSYESTTKSRNDCQEWMMQYSVIPGKTWGAMPSDVKASWLQNRCDLYVTGA